MQIIGTSELRKDAGKHSNTKQVIEAWLEVVQEAKWNDITQVRQTYRTADYVNGRTIFNIKGNSYRLIVVIDYSLQMVVYEAFLTHAEYDKYNFKL